MAITQSAYTAAAKKLNEMYKAGTISSAELKKRATALQGLYNNATNTSTKSKTDTKTVVPKITMPKTATATTNGPTTTQLDEYRKYLSTVDNGGVSHIKDINEYFGTDIMGQSTTNTGTAKPKTNLGVDPIVDQAKLVGSQTYTAPNGKVYDIKVGQDGQASFVSKADGSTKSFASADAAISDIIKGNPAGAVTAQQAVKNNEGIQGPVFEMGKRATLSPEAAADMTDDEIAMWNQKADQAAFIAGAQKSFNDFSTNILKGQTDFKDVVNQKQKLLTDQLNMNVQNWYAQKAADDANWAKVQDQVDAQVKAQKEKLDLMEKEFIKGQAAAKQAWDNYAEAQNKQANIETAGESAGAAANLTKAGLTGAAVGNALSGISDKNHKRYVDLAKNNFDTVQDMTKQYTDFYNSLVTTMGNVDQAQRGVMEEIARGVSTKLEDLKKINDDYVTDMGDPIHKFIDTQTAEYATQAGDTAKIKANVAAWDEGDLQVRQELVVNNLVRLGGDTPGYAVMLKTISDEDLNTAAQAPTLMEGLLSLVNKYPSIKSAITEAQTTETETEGGDETSINNVEEDSGNTDATNNGLTLDEIFTKFNT